MSPACPKPSRTKRKAKKRSKSERKIVEKQLWDLASLYIRARDGKCVTCGTREGLTISHWVKAGKQRVRYDERNVNCQCSTCNDTHNRWTYHYDNYMLRTYSKEDLLELTEWSKENKWKWSVPDLRRMVYEYKVRCDELDYDGCIPFFEFRDRVKEVLARCDTWQLSEPQTVGEAVAATYGTEKG